MDRPYLRVVAGNQGQTQCSHSNIASSHGKHKEKSAEEHLWDRLDNAKMQNRHGTGLTNVRATVLHKGTQAFTQCINCGFRNAIDNVVVVAPQFFRSVPSNLLVCKRGPSARIPPALRKHKTPQKSQQHHPHNE